MSFAASLARGRIVEGRIARFLMELGWTITPTYEIEIESGKGPQVFCANRTFVAPDIIGFRHSRVEFFESKHKSVFTWSRRCNQWETGIDRRHYQEYLALRKHLGRPIWLLFLHTNSEPHERDKPYCPATCPTGLFGGELLELEPRVCHEDSRWGKTGMVYWGCNALRAIAPLNKIPPALADRDIPW